MYDALNFGSAYDIFQINLNVDAKVTLQGAKRSKWVNLRTIKCKASRTYMIHPKGMEKWNYRYFRCVFGPLQRSSIGRAPSCYLG